MKLCEQEKCVGCFACMNICPKGAISIGYNDLDKTIPVIDDSKCINCGLCQSVCPVIQGTDFKEPQVCYAAWTKIDNDKKSCASGGIATALYRTIMEDGGAVFGCAFDDELNLNIRMAESENDLELFKGSKYVQSCTEFSYKAVKEQLENGKKVLYVGSPCQIDGLLHYLRKPYDNLYTVDIICHGVPPIKYLQDYLHGLFPGKKLENIAFRGERDFELCIDSDNERIYQKHSYLDLYYHGFLKGMMFRDNCFKCSYAKKDRVSDMTIGDFWELDKSSLEEKYYGNVSVILTNSTKGEELLDMSKEKIHFEKRTIAEALKGNDQLNHPFERPKDREKFEKNYNKGIAEALRFTSIGSDVRLSELKNCKVAMAVKKIIKRG
ncbi:MAG: Coenzyme F420 hydrogenase/dehydrogenase, beta subunit C-terminal domain [Agathobacter sp.]|nr:Coenzyme F420 hydrogenase/dehydrogenase, beta subunit C-terminal domain [Agathobacter sp.]